MECGNVLWSGGLGKIWENPRIFLDIANRGKKGREQGKSGWSATPPVPEVADRTVSLADAVGGTGADGFCDVRFGKTDGFGEGMAEGEMGGNGG